MNAKKIPFNIALIDPIADKYLYSPFSVDNMAMFDSETGDFHPRGLYSNIIFGKQGDKRRFTQYSQIDLHTAIFSPFYLKQLKLYKPLYSEIILQTSYAVWNEETGDFEKSNAVTGDTGYSLFLKHFDKIKFKKDGNVAKEKLGMFLEENRSKALIKRFIILPAGMRDVEFDDGRPVEDELNPIYKKIISQAKTVNTITAGQNDPVMDNARRILTSSCLLAFSYIFDMFEGKRGVVQSKFLSRKVFGTTRNVISSQELGSHDLEDIRAPRQDTTVVGMTQFMSGMQHKMRYMLKEDILKDFISNVRGEVVMYDPKTLQRVTVTLPEKVADKWSTEDGLNSTMASFIEPEIRHQVILAAGNAIRLIYRDEKGFKLIDDIEAVPEDKRKNVKPITYAELFYLAAAPLVPNVRGINTRYPVTGLGSTFPSRTYLKTTEFSQYLHPYDDNWNLETDNQLYVEFPNTEKRTGFHDTMIVHTSTLARLGADWDGDMLSWSPLWSPDAVEEIDKVMSRNEYYLTPSGDLVYELTTDITNWVLKSLTGDF